MHKCFFNMCNGISITKKFFKTAFYCLKNDTHKTFSNIRNNLKAALNNEKIKSDFSTFIKQ